MLYFILYSLSLILFNSLYSSRNYNKYNSVYKNLDFWKFDRIGNLIIANNNTKNEFVMISDWNYRISPGLNLVFDLWCLVDLHQLFWLIRFNNKVKKLNSLKFI